MGELGFDPRLILRLHVEWGKGERLDGACASSGACPSSFRTAFAPAQLSRFLALATRDWLKHVVFTSLPPAAFTGPVESTYKSGEFPLSRGRVTGGRPCPLSGPFTLSENVEQL